jgi:hypothetical protein
MDDKFVVFTMVQHTMTGLSGAASEEEKVAIITKAVFSMLIHNGGNSSWDSENCDIQCQRYWETGLRASKTVSRTEN